MEAYFGLDIGRYIFIRLKVSNEQTIASRQYINHSDRHFRLLHVTAHPITTHIHTHEHACLRHSNFLSYSLLDRSLIHITRIINTVANLQVFNYCSMRSPCLHICIQLFVLVCCFWLKFLAMPCVQRNRPILVHLLDHSALDNSRTIQRVGSLRKIPVLCSNGMRCFFSKKGTFFTGHTQPYCIRVIFTWLHLYLYLILPKSLKRMFNTPSF